MGPKDSQIEKQHDDSQLSEADHDGEEVESAIEKRQTIDEVIADQMRGMGFDAQVAANALSKIENAPLFSHIFSSLPRIVTSRGIIKVQGKYFDYVQIVQRD